VVGPMEGDHWTRSLGVSLVGLQEEVLWSGSRCCLEG
jgi:hypothetical protein